ncbi:MFS transporter [Rathayibacter sp. YIM 133350]|uniref:MFS transporter n=1 Tax=Rathayibacter sp. YIM 133350 TaxID=3131992 RepID=UPI00307DE368
MSMTERPFRLRSVALAAYLPTLLFSIGEGCIIPLIPTVASNLGASLALAGFIAAMIMLGELIGDIPSGWLVSRIGERTAMIGGAILAMIGVFVCLLAASPWVLAAGIFLVGLATAVFALARHAFMTSYVPMRYRARALSTLGGVFRAGWFVGPFVAAGLLHLTGRTQAVFWVFIAACVGVIVLLLLLPDPERMFGTAERVTATTGAVRTLGAEEAAEESQGLFSSIRTHAAVLLRLGTGAALIAALRSSRTVILPLWALSIGMSERDTALVIGVAGAVDFALFYTSGQVMDRFGRIWVAVPSMIGLGLGHIALAFTHDAGPNVQLFIAIAIFLSVANGIGSGILMTLGADLAPPADPAPFLGAWRFTGDAGGAAAPLLVAALTAVASIAVASGVMGALGLIGAALLARYLPRYAPSRRRRRVSGTPSGPSSPPAA